MSKIGWKHLDVDGLVSSDPIEVLGITCTWNNNGDQVRLYQGQDASSGRLIHSFKGEKDRSRNFLFPGGIPCDSGAYVDLDSGCEATVYYKTYPTVAELEAE